MSIHFDSAATPYEIERRSFALIEEKIPKPRKYEGDLWTVARRCIHTTGDITILRDLVLTENALERGLAAILRGCTVFTDTTMAKVGITRRFEKQFPFQKKALLETENLEKQAHKLNTTLSAAAVRILCNEMADSIVVIGNAPTALITYVQLLEKGAPKPSLIVGMPVGFVNADASKEYLLHSGYPCFTIRGFRGGSALAASCVNALFEILAERQSLHS